MSVDLIAAEPERAGTFTAAARENPGPVWESVSRPTLAEAGIDTLVSHDRSSCAANANARSRGFQKRIASAGDTQRAVRGGSAPDPHTKTLNTSLDGARWDRVERF